MQSSEINMHCRRHTKKLVITLLWILFFSFTLLLIIRSRDWYESGVISLKTEDVKWSKEYKTYTGVHLDNNPINGKSNSAYTQISYLREIATENMPLIDEGTAKMDIKLDSSPVLTDGTSDSKTPNSFITLPWNYGSKIDTNVHGPSESDKISRQELKIYVYELSHIFDYDFTKCIYDKLESCGTLDNHGYGEKLYRDNELTVYGTWQFALEKIMHDKMLKSPYRTSNYSEANIFYVPFYSGISCLCFNSTRDVVDNSSVYHRQLTNEMVRFLKMHPSNAFNNGLLHLMALSKIEVELACEMCPILITPGIEKLHFIGIEQENLPYVRDSRGIANIKPLIVVPYPSYGHIDNSFTQNKYIKSLAKINRTVVLFLAAATTRKGRLRDTIVQQFYNFQTELSYTKYRSKMLNSSSEAKFNQAWLITEECLGRHNNYTLEWMKHSLFCLQPPGDSPTRKSFYDAIISGCIPVLFSQEYKVKYPFEKYLNYSDFTVVLNTTDIMERNKTVSELMEPFVKNKSAVKRMQDNLLYVLPYLQYGDFSLQEPQDAMYFVYKEIRDLLQV